MSNFVIRLVNITAVVYLSMAPIPIGARELVAQTAATPPALTEAQIAAIKAMQVEAEKKAAPTATQLAAVVRRIYDNNLSDDPDPQVRARLDEEMKELVWQLLLVKGDLGWSAFRVLTPQEKQMVRDEIAKPQKPGVLPDLMEVIGKLFKPAPK